MCMRRLSDMFHCRMPLKGSLYLLVYICLCACMGCVSEEEKEESTGIRVGDSLPEFSVVMNDGQVVDRETLRGKPSCVVFFNTSCGDCRKEFPVLESIYQVYGVSGRVNFVLISREESSESVAGYWQENGLSMPYSAQTDRSVYNLFASSAIPRIYVSDEDLNVRAVYTDSPLATEEDLDGVLKGLSDGTD